MGAQAYISAYVCVCVCMWTTTITTITITTTDELFFVGGERSDSQKRRDGRSGATEVVSGLRPQQ